MESAVTANYFSASLKNEKVVSTTLQKDTIFIKSRLLRICVAKFTVSRIVSALKSSVWGKSRPLISELRTLQESDSCSDEGTVAGVQNTSVSHVDVVGGDGDALHFWREHQCPCGPPGSVSSCLAVPASSAAVEPLYSADGMAFRPARCCL